MDDRLKLFRAWDVVGGRREIFSPEESLPSDDLVFFLLDLIPQLDLTAIYGFYSKDRRGQPPLATVRRTPQCHSPQRHRPPRHRLPETTHPTGAVDNHAWLALMKMNT